MELSLANISEQTQAYQVGRPMETSALIDVTHFSGKITSTQDFTLTESPEGCLLEISLASTDKVYGLGQQYGNYLRNGQKHKLFNRDEFIHTPGAPSLYGSHPWIVKQQGDSATAFLIYSPAEINVDIGSQDPSQITIQVASHDFQILVIHGPHQQALLTELLRWTGLPWLPPRWAFGYHQSRWGYHHEDDIRQLAQNFKTHNFPCSAIYLDLDYMDRYRVFTQSMTHFPNLQSLTGTLDEQGIKVVAIVDPGVARVDDFSVWQEGIENDYFCKTDSGEVLQAWVWPGRVAFPDFLQTACRKWWGQKYRILYDWGIAGFWNDMNEPAVFAREEEWQQLADTQQMASVETGLDMLDYKAKVSHFGTSTTTWEDWNHKTDAGELVPHKSIHNLYGGLMAQSLAEEQSNLRPGERHFMITRSSFIGSHRHCGVWTGDNHSWWEHLRQAVYDLMALGSCGFFYSGADLGGFGGDAEGELIVRWMQLGIFSPLCRNHACLGTRRQEPWEFDTRTLDLSRVAMNWRYRLLPYAYSEFLRGRLSGLPPIRHLNFSGDYPEMAHVSDQFLFGSGIMVCPILEANVPGRMVLLPREDWLYCPLGLDHEAKIMPKGHHWIDVEIDQVPAFLRKGHLTVFGDNLKSVEFPEILTVRGFINESAELEVIHDDGKTLASPQQILKIFVKIEEEQLITHAVWQTLDESPRLRQIHYEIHTEKYGCLKTTVDLN